jgi:hypothetical protein
MKQPPHALDVTGEPGAGWSSGDAAVTQSGHTRQLPDWQTREVEAYEPIRSLR